MKIYIAADHAGFDLKSALVDHLKSHGHQVEDCGPHTLDPDDDYPDFIIPCAQKVADDTESLGIVIGGSGNGEAIAANKVKGIRAAVYNSGPQQIAKAAKEHNNANILSLGARFITQDEVQKAVDLWLNTQFAGGRHQRRIDKISKFEDQ